FVTHDQEEALEVADRVVVMDHGRVLQVGSAREVYDHPATPFVYHFLGSVNLFQGRLAGGHVHVGDSLTIPTPQLEHVRAEKVVAYVRPHDLDVVRDTADAWQGLAAVVAHLAVVGPVVRLELERSDTGETIALELSRETHAKLALKPGERIRVRP